MRLRGGLHRGHRLLHWDRPLYIRRLLLLRNCNDAPRPDDRASLQNDDAASGRDPSSSAAAATSCCRRCRGRGRRRRGGRLRLHGCPRRRVRRSDEVIGAHPGLEPDLDEVGGDKRGERRIGARVKRRDGDEGDEEERESDERGREEILHLRFFWDSRSKSNRW